MPITSQEEHSKAKELLSDLYPSRLNSWYESERYNKLLLEVTEYELSKGMITEEDFNDLNRK